MNKVKCLIYCTKNGENLLHFGCGTGEYRCVTNKNQKDVFENEKFNPNDITRILNGKIVAQFDCEKVEEIFYNGWWGCYANDKDAINCLIFFNELTCLTTRQIKEYLGDKNGYAIHISNLEIFDEPYNVDKCSQYRKWNTRLKNAPQNMCEVYGKDGNHYVLISIKPEWVAKILNGEKTIEVRKKVLNCLKELI